MHAAGMLQAALFSLWTYRLQEKHVIHLSERSHISSLIRRLTELTATQAAVNAAHQSSRPIQGGILSETGGRMRRSLWCLVRSPLRVFGVLLCRHGEAIRVYIPHTATLENTEHVAKTGKLRKHAAVVTTRASSSTFSPHSHTHQGESSAETRRAQGAE